MSPPFPQRLQEVRRAKFTLPHLKRGKKEILRNNEDRATLSGKNYRLSGQTQSPLLILSFEDMILFVDASRFACSREVSQIYTSKTGLVSFPDLFTSGRIQNKIQNGACWATMCHGRFDIFSLFAAFLFYDLSHARNRDPRILHKGQLLAVQHF